MWEHKTNRRTSNTATNSSNYISQRNTTAVSRICLNLACVNSISHPQLLVLVSVNNALLFPPKKKKNPDSAMQVMLLSHLLQKPVIRVSK